MRDITDSRPRIAPLNRPGTSVAASRQSAAVFREDYRRRSAETPLRRLGSRAGLSFLLAAGGFVCSAGTESAARKESPQFSPLLVDASGKPITSKRQWLKQREVLRQHWLDVLGSLPTRKVPLKTELLNTEHLAEFSRQHLRYQVEKDLFTDGYLLTPRNRKWKLPALVVSHPTTPLQAKGVAGLDAEYPEEKWQGVQLVTRGYVVWCPRNYINTEGADWKGNAQRVRARHPNWTGMMRMVWDAIRAADFLESLPNVDKKRIGCLGHSLGGKEVLYAMAFDERYRAGVSSEGGIGLRFSNWDAPWYLGIQIKPPDFKRENHEVLALIAPRAFLLLAGDSADDDSSGAFIEAAKPVYALFGAADKVRLVNHRLGHRYPPEARAVAEEFLDERGSCKSPSGVRPSRAQQRPNLPEHLKSSRFHCFSTLLRPRTGALREFCKSLEHLKK